ncbi:MAG: invasion associated locus B family protein [Methylocella sp.]
MSRSLVAAIVLPLLGSSIAHAQSQTLQIAQADAASKPAETPPSGSGGKAKIFGEWALICGAAPGSSEEICEIDATLRADTQSPPVAKVAFVRGAKDQPSRLVAIIVANLTLEPGVEIASEPDKAGVILTFKSCLNDACLADVNLTADQLRGFHSRTKSGRLTIKDAAGEPLSLAVPVRGLDEALDALFAQRDK